MNSWHAASKLRLQNMVTDRQKLIDRYKLALGCEDCGYRVHARALDLDHEPPALKIANVSRLLRFANWDVVVVEVAKCSVRCSNCHRIKTFEREGMPGAG